VCAARFVVRYTQPSTHNGGLGWLRGGVEVPARPAVPAAAAAAAAQRRRYLSAVEFRTLGSDKSHARIYCVLYYRVYTGLYGCTCFGYTKRPNKILRFIVIAVVAVVVVIVCTWV